MPEKTKTYERVIFTPEVIKEAIEELKATLSGKSEMTFQSLTIGMSPQEKWRHDTEEEFFADYRKGFSYVSFEQSYRTKDKGGSIEIWSINDKSEVSISLGSRVDVEKVFSIFEQNVDKCRLPKQPKDKSKAETHWVNETVNRIETHCPIAARKVRLALLKLNSEDAEEWQNATMLIRDAWIELSQWLCQVKNIDASDIPPDSVIDRLKRLKIDKTDERLFNLARASFSLYSKHHKRDIDLDTAVTCVISTVVSMKTVIKEVLNATG